MTIAVGSGCRFFAAASLEDLGEHGRAEDVRRRRRRALGAITHRLYLRAAAASTNHCTSAPVTRCAGLWCVRERTCFVGAGDEKARVARGRERRERQRDARRLAVGERRVDRVDDDVALALDEPGLPGKQRRGVAVLAHAEPDQIDHRRRAERRAQLSLVARRASAMRWTRVEPERIDQVPLRHAVVRVGMIGRHGALVAPPQLDAVPRQCRVARREHVEQALRRRAARQRDVKRRPRVGRDERREVIGARVRERVEIGERTRSPLRISTWPPNWNRIADSTFSANEWSWRERNRVNSEAAITSAGTDSSIAAITVHRPSPESCTLPVNFVELGILDQRLRGEIDQPRRQHAAAPPHLGDVRDRNREPMLLGDRRVRARPS